MLSIMQNLLVVLLLQIFTGGIATAKLDGSSLNNDQTQKDWLKQI